MNVGYPRYTSEDYRKELVKQKAELAECTDPAERVRISARISNVNSYLAEAERRETVIQ